MFVFRQNISNLLLYQLEKMKTCRFSNCIVFFFIASGAGAVVVNTTSSSTDKGNVTIAKESHGDQLSAFIPKSRRKRYISQGDMLAILEYHNQVRANVFPPAANMEYMVSFFFNNHCHGQNVIYAKLIADWGVMCFTLL